MTSAAGVSPQIRQYLLSRGYTSTQPYQVNRIPSFALPRTTAFSLTTLACSAVSLLGMLYTRRAGLYYQGWMIAFGVTLATDLLARRESDNLTLPSSISSPSLEVLLERHPEFKKAYEIVDAEMDARIAELHAKKSSLA